LTSALTAGLGALVVFSLVLLVLDLWERFRDRPTEGGVAAPSWQSGLFVVAVLLVYSVIQFAGVALVPGVADVVDGVRALSGTTALPASANIPGPWLTVLVWVAAFYFLGLIDYLFHRFASHSRPLWFTHENHHLPRELYVYMPGIAARPFVVVAAFPAVVGLVATLHFALAAFGVHGFDIVSLMLFLAMAQLFISSASHSAFLRRHWIVHRMMKPFGLTTPQEHWYHHVQELEVNYGNFTTVWDRVFGTYLDPAKVDATRYRTGLDYDQDFLGTLTLGKLKLGRGIRERFQLEQFCYLEAETAD
jgi:sterol desaturase/sphingolipid hydroxylase (fatty acid hydroxylase superfamily)